MKRTISVFGVLAFFGLVIMGLYYFSIGKSITRSTEWAKGKLSVTNEGEYDVIVVGKGEMIPVDGRICKGKTYLDTKNITGESRARSVGLGDEVLSGSLNIGNIIEVRVIRTYNNSMMTRILDLVENATINKSKAENFISRFCRYYTPVVVILAAIILVAGVVSSFFINGEIWQYFGGSNPNISNNW